MSPKALVLCALVLSAGFAPACRADLQTEKARAIRSGDALVAAQQYARAALAYQRAATADPTDGALRVKLAKTYEQAQMWTQAANEAMRAADLLPNDFDARLLASRLVLLQGRFDDSLTITTALLHERPADPDLLILWGTAAARLTNSTWALYKLGPTGGVGEQYEEGCTTIRPKVGPDHERSAEAALRRAVALAPQSADATLALLNYLWAARRADESAELLQKAAADFPLHGFVNEIAGYFFLARHQYALGERYLEAAATAMASYSRAPRLALVDHYLAVDRPADALTHLAHMTPADDEAGVISARRADAQIRLGRYDTAATELDAMLGRYPKHRRGLALRAQLLLKTGKTADALVTAREAVAADLTSAEARVALADTLSVMADLDGAFTEYAEALRLDPARTRLTPTLARLGLATGRNRSALLYARQAVGLYPDDLPAKVAVVTSQVRLRDYSGAAMALAPLLQLKPLPVAVQLQHGLLEAGRGNDGVARAALEGALKARPDSFEALAGLVNLELDRGRVAAARQRFDQVAASRSDDPAVLKIGSRVFRAERDLQGAEAALRRALRIQPADSEAALLLADCLAAGKRLDEARQVLDQVLQRQPTAADALVAMGTVQEQLGHLDEAQARYQRVLADDPGAATAAARLAILAVRRQRNLDVVLSYLTEAKRTSPDDLDVSDALGWVYLHKGLYGPAVRNLEDAARGNPRHAGYQYHLGVAYAKAGQADKARVALAQSLTLDDDFADRPGAEAALAALPR